MRRLRVCLLAILALSLVSVAPPAFAQGKGKAAGNETARQNRRANADKHLRRARAFEADGKHAAAEAQYRAAMKIDPDYVDAHVGLGWSVHRQGRSRDAVLIFEEIIDGDPDNLDPYFALAEILISLGRTDEARRHVHEAERRGGRAPAALRERLGRDDAGGGKRAADESASEESEAEARDRDAREDRDKSEGKGQGKGKGRGK